jgi:hypothetical protein
VLLANRQFSIYRTACTQWRPTFLWPSSTCPRSMYLMIHRFSLCDVATYSLETSSFTREPAPPMPSEHVAHGSPQQTSTARQDGRRRTAAISFCAAIAISRASASGQHSRRSSSKVMSLSGQSRERLTSTCHGDQAFHHHRTMPYPPMPHA